MYKLQNGFTKESMKQKIREGNSGSVCKNDHGQCSYLNNSGNKCVVGCFIPDGHEAQKGNMDAYVVTRAYPDLLSLMPLNSGPMRFLQIVHDNYNSSDCLTLHETLHEALFDWIDKNVTE